MTEVVGAAVGDGLGAMQTFLDEIVVPSLQLSTELEDAARGMLGTEPLVTTTDLFTVDPIEFPGGNIGTLAACGVINDLAAAGARIEGVAVGLLMAPELCRDTLARMLRSLAGILMQEGAAVWCGDTKVVPGLGSQMMLSVTAFGRPATERRYALADVPAGSSLIITGPIGSHSVAVLSEREGLGFERAVRSDVAPLARPVLEALLVGGVHGLRDLTRGGLVGALWDGARATGLRWTVEDAAIPVDTWVRAATEVLGLDPLSLTNEGCMLVAADPGAVPALLKAFRSHPATVRAVAIGRVHDAPSGVTSLSADGRESVLPHPSGTGVPRLC